jgi:hypothetical protein
MEETSEVKKVHGLRGKPKSEAHKKAISRAQYRRHAERRARSRPARELAAPPGQLM